MHKPTERHDLTVVRMRFSTALPATAVIASNRSDPSLGITLWWRLLVWLPLPDRVGCVMVVWNVVVVFKEEREGEGEWFRAMSRTVRRVPSTGPRSTRVLSLCAKLRRTYHPSLQVF